jgi:diaminopimelate epimerase
MIVPFTKMHGLGNDVVILDLVNNPMFVTPEQIRYMADRHFGIGFDQLLQIEPPSSKDVDFDYRIFNADGNEVEHCGNGARCFAIFVRDKGLSKKNPLRVKTVNGVLELHIDREDQVTVNMGTPRFLPEQIPFQAERQAQIYTRSIVVNGIASNIEFSALSMGNPHAVIIVEEVENAPLEDVGTALGLHPDFSQGVNVSFMEIVNRDQVKLRVLERGVGETLACGTGACAAMVAGCTLGLLDDTVSIWMRGGKLTVSWKKGDSPVLMRGPAITVFEGKIQL